MTKPWWRSSLGDLYLLGMGRDTHTAKKLPMLDNIKIASPCSESWDGMVGDDRVRFCGGCMKNVYNLSAMTGPEAQELIADKEGDVCVRLYRRKDGTVITSDCPVGVRRQRVTKIAAAALAFGGAALAIAAVEPSAEQPCEIPTDVSRTRRAPRTKPAVKTPEPKTDFWTELFAPEEPHHVEMGDVGYPEPARMGKIAPPTVTSPPPPVLPENDKVPQL